MITGQFFVPNSHARDPGEYLAGLVVVNKEVDKNIYTKQMNCHLIKNEKHETFMNAF